MAFANYFYHAQTKKYAAVFGSLFNEIAIERQDGEATVKRIIVPISYGPWQKTLNKKIQDPKHDKPVSIVLPRMSYEILGTAYNSPYKIPSIKKILTNEGMQAYSPTPYDIEFSLYIMGNKIEDVYKIVEQIVPFFTPNYTPSVYLIDGIDPIDVPIDLTSITYEDTYEGDYESRRTTIATLNFTMKALYYGPMREKRVIKFVDVNINEGQASVQQNLVDNDDPGKDWVDVEIDDNWGIETVIIEGDENG